MSYPSIESYLISNFKDDAGTIRFALGKEAKAYIGANTEIQINKISEDSLIKAACEFLKYLESEQIEFDIDAFGEASYTVFTRQELEYLSGSGFKVFSMLTLAFLQLGIIEME